MSETGKPSTTSDQSGGMNITAGGDVKTGDHVARDKITHIYQVTSPPPTPLVTDEPPAPGTSPFKGLEYFNEADADLFFGRESLTAKLVGHLRHASRRFLAVVGASGSGKSSLVRAGLVPALKRGEPLADGALPPEGSAHWPIHVITPTSHPLKALAASLTQASESVTATSTLMDDLANESRSLDLAAQRVLSRQAGAHLLIVVDQFEELFTLCRDEAERQAFVNNLLTAVASETDGPTVVVITLRADFYAHCAQYADLRAALEKWQAYIGPMSTEELRQAIEEPAKRNDWEFEPGLVDLLLREVGSEPGALPLLSHALLETWKRRRGRTLTLKGYTESGGVRGAIAKTAETVFNELTPEQQPIARSIFLRLTELGEGTQDTRRRAALTELIPRPEDKAAVEAVLKTLADRRLITTDEETADVAHEALIREWPTLRRWLDEDREGLQIHRHLTRTAQEWDKRNQDESELYRGARRSAAIEWTEEHPNELNALEREFIKASLALEVSEIDKAVKRAAEQVRIATELRRRAVFLRFALMIAIVLAIAASFFGIQANRNEAKAQQQAHIALSRKLAVQAVSHLDNRLDLALLLGIEAYRVDNTVEARGSLLDGLQRNPLLRRLRGHTDSVTSVAFSPDGKMLASGSEDHTIILWDISNPQLPVPLGAPLTGHTDRVLSVAFSPDGKTLASGSWDNTIILWDIVTRQPIGQPLTSQTQVVTSVAFSPDGNILASGTNDSTIILWDVAMRQPLITLSGHTWVVGSVAFSPDGKMLASGSADGTLVLWDMVMRQPIGRPHTIQSLTGPPPTGYANDVTSVAFSPDGKMLASGSNNNAIILWDLRRPIDQPLTGQLLNDQPLISYINSATGVAFSPDGKMLASGSNDDTIILWDVARRQRLGQPLTGHSSGVTSVAFSPDGKMLASGSWDNTIILWDVDVESWIARACNIAARNLTRAEWKQYLGDEPYHKTCEQWPEGE